MRRKALYIAALLGLVLYAWLAIAVYRSKAAPESFKAWDGPGAWIVGPSGKELKRAADRRMDLALEVLNKLEFDSYRRHLLVAEDLLERSLRAQPGQPEVLVKLAAVRWELKPALTDEGAAEYLELVVTASEMAPHSPLVQLRLGRLLMAMGRRDNALPYLRKAAQLRPSQTGTIAELLLAQGYRPADLLEILPDETEVVARLRPNFSPGADLALYIDTAKAHLVAPSRYLLASYGSACLSNGEPERLLDALEHNSYPGHSELEAYRLIQVAMAYSALEMDDDAVAEAKRAVALQPENARFRDQSGDIAKAAKDYDRACAEYRTGIGILARQGVATAYRATLYRKIGLAEEENRHPDKAYDAYRMALELNPGEPVAEKKILEMREAAGIK